MGKPYPIGRFIVPAIVRLWIKRVEGLENLPKDRPFIAAANHASFLDGPMLPSIIVPYLNKKIHFLVEDIYFNGLLGKFLYWAGCIPIGFEKHKDRDRKNNAALAKALAYIKNGELAGIFPEGSRSKDGKIQKGKIGVAMLALKSKVPVVPVGIIGSYDIFPKGRSFPKLRRNIVIKIGKPMDFAEFYSKKEDIKALKSVTKAVMIEIGELIGQKYRLQ